MRGILKLSAAPEFYIPFPAQYYIRADGDMLDVHKPHCWSISGAHEREDNSDRSRMGAIEYAI
jgi:hypothetical protein